MGMHACAVGVVEIPEDTVVGKFPDKPLFIISLLGTTCQMSMDLFIPTAICFVVSWL